MQTRSLQISLMKMRLLFEENNPLNLRMFFLYNRYTCSNKCLATDGSVYRAVVFRGHSDRLQAVIYNDLRGTLPGTA